MFKREEDFLAEPTNDYQDTRRKSPRRRADNCISVINGKAYPVHNWSDGGLLVQADDRMFTVASPVDITMKFRLGGRILDIVHRGKVIRKMRDRIAVQFDPITRDISRKFKEVIDDTVTREFAESQFSS
jgi:hypothetical protein